MRSRTILGLTLACIFCLVLLMTSVGNGHADTGQSKDKGKGTGNGGDQSQTDGSQSTDQKGKDSKSDKSSGDKSSTGKDQNASADTAPIQSEVLAFRALRGDAAKIVARGWEISVTRCSTTTRADVLSLTRTGSNLIPGFCSPSRPAK